MIPIRTDYSCSFFGHREIENSKKVKTWLFETVEDLIEKHNVDTFLFGSKSQFDRLALEVVSKCKENHPHLRRIYVRAEYPDLDEGYEAYLAEHYDDSYFPDSIRKAGRAIYVERNYEMIRQSNRCIFYFDPAKVPKARKSGTELALLYAKAKGKEILLYSNCFEE